MDYIQELGFLPLLDSGIRGYSAEDVVDVDCRYVVMDDGGWDWPLWKWKGPIVTEGRCVYGKFFAGKAGFVSKDWWPDLCNYRRSSRPAPAEGSIDEAILLTLAEHGSLITRELRAACGFDGPKMRSKFDGYVTRLQMACRIVTEDFVYPTDKHGREYGWGWSGTRDVSVRAHAPGVVRTDEGASPSAIARGDRQADRETDKIRNQIINTSLI